MIKKEKGFTLVELMVVIVIIGILAALAIPKFMNASVKAKISEAPLVLAEYETLQFAYLQEANKLGSQTDIGWSPPTSKWFTYTGPAAQQDATADNHNDGEADPKASMGDVDAGEKLVVEVYGNSQSAHTQHNDYNKYLKNFAKSKG